jgi:hypothetical protein
VLKDVQANLSGFKMPEGYSMKYTGEQEDQAETSAFLMQSFFISLLCYAYGYRI